MFLYLTLPIKKIYEEVKEVLHYPILAFTAHRKTQGAHIKTINLKYRFQRGMITLNYQTHNILY